MHHAFQTLLTHPVPSPPRSRECRRRPRSSRPATPRPTRARVVRASTQTPTTPSRATTRASSCRVRRARAWRTCYSRRTARTWRRSMRVRGRGVVVCDGWGQRSRGVRVTAGMGDPGEGCGRMAVDVGEEGERLPFSKSGYLTRHAPSHSILTTQYTMTSLSSPFPPQCALASPAPTAPASGATTGAARTGTCGAATATRQPLPPPPPAPPLRSAPSISRASAPSARPWWCGRGRRGRT